MARDSDQVVFYSIVLKINLYLFSLDFGYLCQYSWCDCLPVSCCFSLRKRNEST